MGWWHEFFHMDATAAWVCIVAVVAPCATVAVSLLTRQMDRNSARDYALLLQREAHAAKQITPA